MRHRLDDGLKTLWETGSSEPERSSQPIAPKCGIFWRAGDLSPRPQTVGLASPAEWQALRPATRNLRRSEGAGFLTTIFVHQAEFTKITMAALRAMVTVKESRDAVES
jgi:hypothetical protein